MERKEIIPQIRNKLCGAKGILDLLGLGEKIYPSFLQLAKKDFLEAIELLKELEKNQQS